MGLEKSIEHGKEHRKPFKGAKAVDSQCRNHGDCDYCKSGRLYHSRKALMKAKRKMADFAEDSDNKE
jgi:hypothetical protein